jgi:hypothetical protein
VDKHREKLFALNDKFCSIRITEYDLEKASNYAY